MTDRKVKIINVATGTPITIETSASRLSEIANIIKDEPQFEGVDLGQCHCFVKSPTGSRQAVSITDTCDNLPSGEFKLFISPSKMKGGLTPKDAEKARGNIQAAIDLLHEVIDKILDDYSNTLSEEDQRELTHLRKMLGHQ